VPHKPDPLREQIKRLDALIKADRAERRVAERPLRAERSALKERVYRCKVSLAKAAESRARMMRCGVFIHTQRWRDTVARIAELTRNLADTEQALATFNQLHPELEP
jgi:hypothetical protein